MTTIVQFSDCEMTFCPIGERRFVYFFESERNPRALLDRYAGGRGVEQYPDGSFETGGVCIDCDNRPDSWTGRYEVTFEGKEEDVKRVFDDFKRVIKIDAETISGISMIVEWTTQTIYPKMNFPSRRD